MSGRVEGRRPLPLRAAVVLAELHHIVVTRLRVWQSAAEERTLALSIEDVHS
jgi:hypothetical protein